MYVIKFSGPHVTMDGDIGVGTREKNWDFHENARYLYSVLGRIQVS